MRLPISFVIPLFAFACGGAAEPEAVIGTWYLETYNDAPVPGTAVFRAGTDSSLIQIDSVVLRLETGLACHWLVDLSETPANQTDACIWALDAGPDSLLVTVEDLYQLRGDATAAQLRLRDPNDNLLVFSREPGGSRPDDTDPN
jgi:hypothetical protein